MNLPVTSEISRNMINYLADLIWLNDIPMTESTSKLGWMKMPDGYDFMPYDNKRLTFDADDRFKNIVNSIKPEGDPIAWMDMMREIRKDGRVEPRTMMASSAGSALVERLGANPFAVHLYGQTEGGKTVCLMAATSIWANPNPDAGYMGNFKTTQVALETRADLLNNLPLVLDDTAQVSAKLRDDFDGLIYVLCSGTGKDRSNQELGLRRANTWRLSVLTTGEHPIVSDDSQGGAANRVVQVECGADRIFKDGHRVAETVKANYGWCGIWFIHAIKEIGMETLTEKYKHYFEIFRKAGKMEKQAQSAAIIMVADWILTDHIFKDGIYLTTDEVLTFLRSENEISINLS